jgi:CO dehydrogenase maturation factor
MTKYLAIAGKGGTGKTTIAACMVRYLCARPGRPAVLAIDADPNSNLGEALGLAPRGTIADILDETKQVGPLPAGMSRQTWVQYRLSQLVAEGERFDLLAMGTPEGPGCYCYANDLLRGNLSTLGRGYDYVVIDNEAGLEHLSRRVEQDIDVMLLVSDPTARGLRSACRALQIMRQLKTRVGEVRLIVNRVPAEGLGALAEELGRTEIELLGLVPEDPAVREYDLRGRPLTELPPDSPSVAALFAAFGRLPL